MFSWLTGAPPPPVEKQLEVPTKPAQEVDLFPEGDSYYPPQDSAPVFAVKAFRTAIFGTPTAKPTYRPQQRSLNAQANETKSSEVNAEEQTKPAKPIGGGREQAREEPTEKQDRSKRERAANQELLLKEQKRENEALILDPIPFKITAKTNLFNPVASEVGPSCNLFEATPARPSSPTKGILNTGGAGLAKKKAVTFDASAQTPKANPRVRSGLPHEFPGKFPSPWTPRTGNTPKLTSKRSSSLSALELKPNGETARKRSVGFEVSEDSRIEDIMNEDEDEDGLPTADQADLTVDMNAPKSTSGQYWKEHAENLEGLALSKVDKLRGRCHMAIEYAKLKDQLCADLAERLREVTDKNQRLKTELRRIHNGGPQGPPEENEYLNEALHMITEKDIKIEADKQEMSHMQKTIEQYASRIKTYEDILNSREERITELEVSMYQGETTINKDLASKEQVDELRQKLRKARQEAKDLAPLRLQCRTLKTQVLKLEHEKVALEARVDKMKSIGDESTRYSAKPDNVEAMLKAQVEDLEKSKRELKTEMRAKATEASKERREAERALRADMADLKTKLVSEEMDRKELQREKERLQDLVNSLEEDLMKALAEKSEAKYATADGEVSEEWHKKHRATLQELRQVKEELSTLKMQAGQSASQPPARSWSPVKETLLSKKHGESKVPSFSSEDSATADCNNERPVNRSLFNISPRRSPSKSMLGPMSNFQSFPPPTTSNGDVKDMTLDFSQPPIMPDATPKAQPAAFRQDQSELTGLLFDQPSSTPIKTSSASFLNSRRDKASPRPSVVNIGSPLAKRRTTIGGTKKSGTGSKLLDDPARRAAAERRIAERKAARRKTVAG